MLETETEKEIIPDTQPIPAADDPIEELDKYNRQMDELIEDAEIEAELETAKKIRSKNTRLFTISLIAVLLLGFIYYKTQHRPAMSTDEINEAPLAGLAEELLARQVPVSDETGLAPDLPASKDEISGVIKPAPAVEAPRSPKKPADLSPKPLVNPSSKSNKIESKAKPQTTGPATPIAGVKKTRPADTTRGKNKYSIQLGAFSVKGNAERFSKRLAAKGFNPDTYVKISTVKNSTKKRTIHFVRIAGFRTEEKALATQKKLTEQGFKNSFIVK